MSLRAYRGREDIHKEKGRDNNFHSKDDSATTFTYNSFNST